MANRQSFRIKQQVSHELFILHISMNMIGNWKGEGWWGVISEQAELVPYIPEALQALQLNHLKTAFEDVISIFPAYTIFSNDNECYYDMINFLQNVRFKVTDERLLMIPSEKRKRNGHIYQTKVRYIGRSYRAIMGIWRRIGWLDTSHRLY